jgi:hypothetical protein
MASGRIVLAVGLALMGTLMGCGGGNSPQVCNCPAIQTFTANAASVQEGMDITLTATFTNGNGVVNPGNIPIFPGVPLAVPASLSVQSYTLSVNEPGTTEVVTKSLAVTVTPAVNSIQFMSPAATSGTTVQGKIVLEPGATATLNSPLPEGRGFHGSRRRFPASTGG